MGAAQSQGLGGLSYKSTNDISGTVADVTNGNTVGSAFKNAVGLAAMPDTANDASFVINTTGRTAWSLGIIQDTPKAGMPGQIASVQGTSCKAWLGGTVTRGDKLVPDTSGRLVTMTTTPAYVVAIAQESGVVGTLIEAVIYSAYIPTTP